MKSEAISTTSRDLIHQALETLARQRGESTLTQEQRLERVRRLTQLLDSAWHVPGTNFRVGLDSLIGLIPGVGDVATACVSAYLIHEARQMNVSRWVLMRMAGNVGVDVLVGAIPVLGDLFDFAFKSNQRNLRLLEKHLARVAKRQGMTS